MTKQKQPVTRQEVQAVDDRITRIVSELNDVNRKGREYVDKANAKQDKAIAALEKKLVELFDKMLKDHDKSIRKFISEEAKKVAKSFKK